MRENFPCRGIFHGLLATMTLGITGPVLGHEFWIQPRAHAVEVGEPVIAQLFVGENLEGAELPYLPSYFESFTIHQANMSRPVPGIVGNAPAVVARTESAGAFVLAYRSRPSRIIFDTFDAFRDYLEYEQNSAIAKLHQSLGFPRENIGEVFIRNAKALIEVGDADATDKPVGLPFEFVALDAPREAAFSSRMRIRLLWQGEPVPGHGFNVFQAGAANNPQAYETDSDGIATINVSHPGRYLLNAVQLKPLEHENLHWQSHWASLTFGIGTSGVELDDQ